LCLPKKKEDRLLFLFLLIKKDFGDLSNPSPTISKPIAKENILMN